MNQHQLFSFPRTCWIKSKYFIGGSDGVHFVAFQSTKEHSVSCCVWLCEQERWLHCFLLCLVVNLLIFIHYCSVYIYVCVRACVRACVCVCVCVGGGGVVIGPSFKYCYLCPF